MVRTRLGDRTSEDGARTPILKTIRIDPCQESTKGVKQFHGSFHNTQRKRLPESAYQRLLLIEII